MQPLPGNRSLVQSMDALNFATSSPVVPDQEWNFENLELFKKLRNESQVVYIRSKDNQSTDETDALLEDCRKLQLDVSFRGSGITLTLPFKHHVVCRRHEFSSDFVQVDYESRTVKMVKPLIFNGVCVIFKGWLDLDTQEGRGRLEFDPESARIQEEKRLLSQHRRSLGAVDTTYPVEILSSFYPVSSLSGHHQMLTSRIPQASLLRPPPNVTPIQRPPDLEIPFLTPSASPSESMEMPLTHGPHWKKRGRHHSESSREYQPPHLLPRAPLGVICSDNEVLDLSKSSKTHPPRAPPSTSSSLSSETRNRVVSLDETVSSLVNCSLHNKPLDPSSRTTSRLTPKKKYSTLDFTFTAQTCSEGHKDSSTQTSGPSDSGRLSRSGQTESGGAGKVVKDEIEEHEKKEAH